jgi:DNA helicase-2/ATP-dependent DNA helicase PcrA
MPYDPDEEIGRLVAQLTCGSVVAAAGCGKTEQIARAVVVSQRRRLVLTHTHAGVDAITKRLTARNVPGVKYRVDTIAGLVSAICRRIPTAIRPKHCRALLPRRMERRL